MNRAQKIATTLGVIGVVSASSANGASGGSYAVYGLGGKSCGAYLEAVTKGRVGRGYNEENEFIIWVRGFLSAYNRYTSDTYGILESTDLEGAMAYIENYCRQNPLSKFDTAVGELADELYPRRRITPR